MRHEVLLNHLELTALVHFVPQFVDSKDAAQTCTQQETHHHHGMVPLTLLQRHFQQDHGCKLGHRHPKTMLVHVSLYVIIQIAHLYIL